MTLQEVIESTGTCRLYRTDPVPDAVLRRVLDAGRFAPSGGNRQPVRFIAVCDAQRRRELAQWYLPIWEKYVAQVKRSGAIRSTRMVERADHFAQHLAEVPVLLVVCAVMGDLLPTDRDLDRLTIVGGASVYPAVQNVLLKAREEGLGTALTPLLCMAEPQVKALLKIPDGVGTAAMIALGYPAEPFPRRVRRRPLGEVAFVDEYGAPIG